MTLQRIIRDFRSLLFSYLPPAISHNSESVDLSQRVVLVGPHYVAIGEHADLWIGDMSGKKVAVKVLRGGSSSNPDFLQKFKERLERGAKVWRSLQHPYVSEFYGLAFNFGYMPALILPFYGRGNVVEYVKDKDNGIKFNMVKQIAEGLKYLHGQSVVHGDLRSANVLVDNTGCSRVCDYGLAFIIEPSEFTSVKTAGACRWTAPEIMNPTESCQDENDSESPPLFTEKSDVYALGMTILEIFTGKIPFSQKKNDSSVIFYVLGGGRPELPAVLKEHEVLRDLVQNCWDSEPDNRPTSRTICEILAAHQAETVVALGGNVPWWFRSWL